MSEEKRLYRSRTNRMVAGVCAGLGRYFNIDPVIIRIVWLLLVVVYGTGILAYLIAWLIIPNEPEVAVTPDDDPISGSDA